MKDRKNETEDIKRLKWAISLSQTKIEDLREGDWLNLRNDLYDFTYGRHRILQNSTLLYGAKWGRVKPEAFTQDLITNVAHDFRAWFEQAAHKGEQYKNLTLTVPLRDAAYNDEGCFFVVEEPSGHFAPTFALDDVRIAAKIAFGFHLVESKITRDRIRSCDFCKNIFLAERKPRNDKSSYCDPRCARNAASRAYRERKAEKLEVREKQRAKQRYTAKVQKRFPGKKIKVVSRKPKAQL